MISPLPWFVALLALGSGVGFALEIASWSIVLPTNVYTQADFISQIKPSSLLGQLKTELQKVRLQILNRRGSRKII
jgi:hypothetical protein